MSHRGAIGGLLLIRYCNFQKPVQRKNRQRHNASQTMRSTPPAATQLPGTADGSRHALRKSLGLADLIPMQVLLVVGIT
jgi:hypothetical protein